MKFKEPEFNSVPKYFFDVPILRIVLMRKGHPVFYAGMVGKDKICIAIMCSFCPTELN